MVNLATITLRLVAEDNTTWNKYVLVSYIISTIVADKNIVSYYMTYNKYHYSSYWNLKDYCNLWYKQLIGHGNSNKTHDIKIIEENASYS